MALHAKLCCFTGRRPRAGLPSLGLADRYRRAGRVREICCPAHAGVALTLISILVSVSDRAPAGGTGAILRREGLYSSTLSDWRGLRAARCSRWTDADQARAETRTAQSIDGRTGAGQTRECAADAPAGSMPRPSSPSQKSGSLAGSAAGDSDDAS
jgi:hypothetical protein